MLSQQHINSNQNISLINKMQQCTTDNKILTEVQLQICENAKKFISQSNEQIKEKLKNSNWKDFYAIISNDTDIKICIVCCSALKVLIIDKKYVREPLEMFKTFFYFYIHQDENNRTLVQRQKMVQIVLQTILQNYFTENEKYAMVMQLIDTAIKKPKTSARIFKFIQLVMEDISEQTINNEVIVGEMLQFLQTVVKQQQIMEQYIKIQIIKQTIKLLQCMFDLINNSNLNITQNYISQKLNSSRTAKIILEQIICEGSNQFQIITKEKVINQIKLLALELYSQVWAYHLDEIMFKFCLNSMMDRPAELFDEQSDIMQKIVVMLERSVMQQQYYQDLHKNTQQITISLLGLIKAKESYKNLAEMQPYEYVEINNDLCMDQQREMLQTKACSLISYLCLYIDGYLTFLGLLCIMIIKKFNQTLINDPQTKDYLDYIKAIDLLWVSDDEEKIATCVLILCSVSDQLEKRADLLKPLQHQLVTMNSMFNINGCNLPPYLICRFMQLYSFIAYPNCMDVFLPYKQVKPVYQYQLQSCYNTLRRYYSKYPQYKKYIQQIGYKIVITEQITELLETTITRGQLLDTLQFQILEKLVIWFDNALNMQDRNTCKKMSGLMVQLLEKMTIENYIVTEQAVFKYLQPLLKKMLSHDGHLIEQCLLEVVLVYVKIFPNLSEQKQKLSFLLNMGIKIVQKNNGNLNNCLDLFYYLTKYLPQELIVSLIHIYMICLENQVREEDHWECYYGLQNCMIRLAAIRGTVPHINLQSKLNKIQEYCSEILITKVYMFIFSLILANPENPQCYQQYLLNRAFPTNVVIYQNKPYCLYLIHLSQYLNMSPEWAYNLLLLILSLMNKESRSSELLNEYEHQINKKKQNKGQLEIQQQKQSEKCSEVEVNALLISKKLQHPFLASEFDIFSEFRKCWVRYPYRQYILNNLDERNRNYLAELCSQATINNKVRKIIKIKMNEENGSKTSYQKNQMM